MKNLIRYISALVTFSLIISSCSEPDYQPQSNATCNLDSSMHANHEKYQAVLDSFTSAGIVGITSIISKPNDEDWIGSSGYASIEENIKMTNCNIYQTASLVKSFVGVITIQLIEEGILEYDSKVIDFLPEDIITMLPQADQLTIKHLLQQTSGLADIFEVEFISDFMNNPENSYTRKELISYIENKDALSAVGEKHHYSDTNYILLSLIIDDLLGSHFDAIETRITSSLQLDQTYYHTAGYPEIDALPQSYWDQYNTGQIENISQLQKRVTNYIVGSDGVISSPQNMVKFYQSVFDAELLTQESIDIIINNKVEETIEQKMNSGYSHGFMTIEDGDETWIGHAGSQLGTSCFVFYNIDTQVTIGAFTNTGTFLFIEKQALIFNDLWLGLKNAAQ